MKKPPFMSRKVEKSAYYYLDLTDHSDMPISIVCGGWELCRSDYRIKRATFLYHAVEFIASGKGCLKIAGNAVELLPGMVFSYRPGIPHEIITDPDKPMLKHFIDFTGTEADEVINSTSLARGPVQVSEPMRIKKLFDEIQLAAENSISAHTEEPLLLFRLLMLRIEHLAVRGPYIHSRSMHSFERCRNYVDKEFKRLKSLDDIAHECGMDGATICRLFKRFSDCTPYQYLMRAKMRYAAAQLQNTGCLVKEAAADLGFDDPYHFSRSFKRVHGVSPQQFLELTTRMIRGGAG